LVDSATQKSDTLKLPKLTKAVAKVEIGLDTLQNKVFKPNPARVVWMAAIIPGCGQILNKKYWKLPIVYGGFMTMAYFISWNSSHYNSYKNAYLDILSNDPAATSYLDVLPKGATVADMGGMTNYTNILKNKQDAFRRYRDLSVIMTIGYYALTIVDAYVDAQLYDFDITPDLSLHLQPTLLENRFGVKNTLGMQFCINIK